VIVRFADHTVGILVDKLIGEAQTVIKPLGTLFGGLKAISGSTILGTGEVALILDVSGLLHIARERENAHQKLREAA
jgi:two-component system chemotaxis sensor kinase CheA